MRMEQTPLYSIVFDLPSREKCWKSNRLHTVQRTNISPLLKPIYSGAHGVIVFRMYALFPVSRKLGC